MSDTEIQNLIDNMLDLRAETQKQMERRNVLERLLKCDGYIGIKQLCAIFDIDLPAQAEEAQEEQTQE